MFLLFDHELEYPETSVLFYQLFGVCEAID